MTQQHVQIVFQVIVFLFAISVHESAHAWTANRCGDPTAKMLGRVTLNPIKHIDPIGTILLPALCMITGLPVFGWAKPTPVDPRNFKHEVRDDVLVSVAGPASNFILVVIAVAITSVLLHVPGAADSTFLEPVLLLLEATIIINVILGVFNLLPVPPLDGSHVFRHMLPESARRAYDSIGIFALILVVAFGGRIIMPVVNAILGFIDVFLRS